MVTVYVVIRCTCPSDVEVMGVFTTLDGAREIYPDDNYYIVEPHDLIGNA